MNTGISAGTLFTIYFFSLMGLLILMNPRGGKKIVATVGFVLFIFGTTSALPRLLLLLGVNVTIGDVGHIFRLQPIFIWLGLIIYLAGLSVNTLPKKKMKLVRN
ncbi:MAG: hypothetical protein PHT40_00645 [Patescibacteria group bacterium]|nr:hypothetical protein [Patescibacteria group bacterium]